MNFFSKLFNRKAKEEKQTTELIRIPSNFASWNGNAYESDLFRSAVDAIARNAAKLKATHITLSNGLQKLPNSQRLKRILQVEPNPYMSAYDFLYKLITNLYLTNNAFALLDRDEGGQLQGIYPITYSGAESFMDSEGNLFVGFTFKNGRKSQFEYKDLIHLRRHFSENEFLANDNRALMTALELDNVQNQGLTAAIENSATLRGILKFTQLLGADKLKQAKENFIRDFLSISNSGGVAVTDVQSEFIPLTSPPATIDTAQLDLVKKKVFDYLGISEQIISSSYNEDEFSAFYESTIEPLAVQMSLEFTRKIFSERELSFGNQIIFESGRLQFAANKTKVSLIKELLPFGVLTINQSLEILNLPPVEGGDKRLQTLNVISADKATEYQLQKAGNLNDRDMEGARNDAP